MGKKEDKRIYVAVKYVPRTAPEISWTKAGMARLIKCHRNSLVFKDGLAVVRGWVVYQMYISPVIEGLVRGK